MENIVNEHFRNTIGGSLKNFTEFIENFNESTDISEVSNKEIDFLAKRIAENMFFYKENINTAKDDFITFLGILMKKGLILKT